MPSPTHKLTSSDHALMVRMYEAGLSLGPIAAHFGVSRQGAWSVLRKRIDLRTHAVRQSRQQASETLQRVLKQVSANTP